MAHAPDKLMTADELLALGDIGRTELIGGELVRMSPANPRHGVLVTFLAALLDRHVRPKRLGRVMTGDAGFRLASGPDTVRAPDVAFVSGDRARSLPKRGYFPGPPDLAVEVVSPEDRWSELQAKAQDWIQAGCRLVWIVDPGTQTVTVYLPDGSSRIFKRGDSVDGGDLLPGFRLHVAAVFDELV